MLYNIIINNEMFYIGYKWKKITPKRKAENKINMLKVTRYNISIILWNINYLIFAILSFTLMQTQYAQGLYRHKHE